MDKKRENKKLIERYPFLLPLHRLTGKHPANFDFGFTELDALPDGWRAAFGKDICKEIMEELTQNDCVNTYHILQIKEKYGQLHWYSQGGTKRFHHEIVPKYEMWLSALVSTTSETTTEHPVIPTKRSAWRDLRTESYQLRNESA